MKKLYKSLNFKTYQPHSKKYPNQTEPKTGLILYKMPVWYQFERNGKNHWTERNDIIPNGTRYGNTKGYRPPQGR